MSSAHALLSAGRMEEWVPPGRVLIGSQVVKRFLIAVGSIVLALGLAGLALDPARRRLSASAAASGVAAVCVGAVGLVWYRRNGPRLIDEAEFA